MGGPSCDQWWTCIGHEGIGPIFNYQPQYWYQRDPKGTIGW